MSCDLGHEANPKSAKGCSKNGDRLGNGPNKGLEAASKNISQVPLQMTGRQKGNQGSRKVADAREHRLHFTAI